MEKKIYKIHDVIKANSAWTNRRVLLRWFLYLVIAILCAWGASTFCKTERGTSIGLVICCGIWTILFFCGLMTAMSAVASVIFVCSDGTLGIRLMGFRHFIHFEDMENVTVPREGNKWLLDNGKEKIDLPVGAFPNLDTELPRLMLSARNNPSIYREYPL